MQIPVVQELEKTRKTPEECKSDFSFFLPKFQKEFSSMEYDEIKYLFQVRPADKARYIYELWRTGRMEVVYEYFADIERTMQESLVVISPDGKWSTGEITMDEIAFNTAIMLHKGVPEEKCIVFLHDLICVSSNAHDNQKFGEAPLNLDTMGNVEGILKEMVLEYSSSMKNL